MSGLAKVGAANTGGPLLPEAMVARERLVNRLESSAALTILRAPGGGGKTVALAQWAATRDKSHGALVWISVDVATAERQAFWTSVVEAILRCAEVPPDALLNRLVPALSSTKHAVRLIVRALLELPADLTLVIDNADRLRGAEITDDLRAVLVACPSVFVVIAGRDVTPLESPSTASLLSTLLIDEDELAFTVDETAEVLRQAELPDPDELAAPLHHAVGGLPLATRFVVLSIRINETETLADALRERASSTVADFIAAQLSARASVSLLPDFLVRTSIAPELSVSLAAQLARTATATTATAERTDTTATDAQTLLDEAEAAGLGMWGLIDGERRFVYTSVIGAELRGQLALRFPDEVAGLKRIVAEWSFDHRRFLPALELAVSIGDYDLASRVVKTSWSSLLANNPQGVIDVLSRIPLRAFRLNPLLAFCLALAYNLFDDQRLKAREMLGVAAVAARLRRPPSGSADSVLLKTIEGIASRLLGRTDAAHDSAISALDAYAELSSAARADLAEHAPIALVHNGTTLLYAGLVDRALLVFQECYATAGPELSIESCHARSMIAGTLALRGDIPEARAIVEEIRAEEWPVRWKESYSASFYRIAEAILAIEAFDFAEARRQLDTLSELVDTIEHWPLIASLEGQILLGAGDPAAGLAAMDAWSAKWRRGPRWQLPLSREVLATTRALLHLSLGQSDAASQVLENSPGGSAQRFTIPFARIALCRGDASGALELLRESDPASECPRLVAERLVLAAAASLRLGSTGAALADLEQATMFIEDRQLSLPLMLLPSADIDALASISEEHGLYRHAKALATRIPRIIGQTVPPTRLTGRELVVLRALVATASVQEIADQTFVSKNTVKTQLRSLYRKLGVTSRDEALRVAVERALVKRQS